MENNINYPIEAVAAIEDTLLYGKLKGHPAGSWRKESVHHHIDKAHGHIHDYLNNIDRDEDHLECALTILAMAVSVKRGKIVNP